METAGDVDSVADSGDDAEVATGEVGTAVVNTGDVVAGDASAADVGAAEVGTVAPLQATDTTHSMMTPAERRSSCIEQRRIPAG